MATPRRRTSSSGFVSKETEKVEETPIVEFPEETKTVESTLVEESPDPDPIPDPEPPKVEIEIPTPPVFVPTSPPPPVVVIQPEREKARRHRNIPRFAQER